MWFLILNIVNFFLNFHVKINCGHPKYMQAKHLLDMTRMGFHIFLIEYVATVNLWFQFED